MHFGGKDCANHEVAIYSVKLNNRSQVLNHNGEADLFITVEQCYFLPVNVKVVVDAQS